jgi:hypothetical protein
MEDTMSQLINYNGILFAEGNTITQPTDVTFTIWDFPTGGESVWSETQTVNPQSDGSYFVLLGSVSPIPELVLTSSMYLSWRIGEGPESSPRSLLTPVESSFQLSSLNAELAGSTESYVCIEDPAGFEVCVEDNHIVIRGTGGDADNLEEMPVTSMEASTAESGTPSMTEKRYSISIPLTEIAQIIIRGTGGENDIEMQVAEALAVSGENTENNQQHWKISVLNTFLKDKELHIYLKGWGESS